MKYFATLILIYISFAAARGQKNDVFLACGADTVNAEQIKTNPALAEQEQLLEAQYRTAMTTAKKGSGSSVLALPVVVHIIHNGGLENISDARVLKGIEYLNDAFRNRNYYNPATGVDVEIEFCLAKRDMQGNAFSGIRRIQSPLTDMSATSGSLSALTNWDTKNYINITLVREVCLYGDCAVAGYANSPGAHGQAGDGIVMEAEYFGSSPRDGVVTAHEIGHYLGLMHTFLGGCKNDNCLLDGDRVCDTPPDNMTGPYPCTAAYNSCQTDMDDPAANNPFRSPALGGLGDQNDMLRNYMDYSILECYDRFTSGQKARMRFFVETSRSALLSSKACLPPCPLMPLASFSLDRDSIEAGESIITNNMSVNASGFRWYIDGQLISLAADTTFQFTQEGVYVLRLEALSPWVECDNAVFEKTVKVVCPVKAAFTFTHQGNWLHFSSQSARADSVKWIVKDGSGAVLFTSTHPGDSLDVSVLQYLQLCLDATNAFCADRYCTYIKLIVDSIDI